MGEAREEWASHWRNVGISMHERDVYYYMDSVKLSYARPLLRPRSRCLEVGSGSGRLSALLALEGHQLTCLDYTAEALRAARRNFDAINMPGRFVQGDAFMLPFSIDSFDAVFSTGLLEHFRDPLPIVAGMVRVLRPGGVFFSDIVPRKFSSLRAFDFMRPGPPVFERSFTRREIVELLAMAGLKRIRVFPGGVFPPLWLPLVIRSKGYRRMHSQLVRAMLPLLRRLDGTRLAEKVGFYWFCSAYKES